MTEESGWVIEYGASSPSAPLYFVCGDRTWGYKSTHAIRFARQRDATAHAQWLDRSVPAINRGVRAMHRVVNHIWSS